MFMNQKRVETSTDVALAHWHERALKAERELEVAIAMLDRHQARAFALRTAVDDALTAYLKP